MVSMDDKLLDSLDSVTWYNGLASEILKWKEDGYLKQYEDFSLSWKWEDFISHDIETRSQLQVFWMICVELFGECGTSPRTGWILLENKEAFHKFIDEITQSYREWKEREGDEDAED